jgi:hypothetical protein
VRTDPALTASTPGIILSSRVISTDIPILFFWASRCLPTFSDCREINGDRMRSCKFHSKQIVDCNQALHSPVSVTSGGPTTFENDTQATKFVFNRRRSTVIAQTKANEPQKLVCRTDDSTPRRNLDSRE